MADKKPADQRHFTPPHIPTLEEFKKANPGMLIIEETAEDANWLRDVQKPKDTDEPAK